MKARSLVAVFIAALVWLAGHSGLMFGLGLILGESNRGVPAGLTSITVVLISSVLLGIASLAVAVIAGIQLTRLRRARIETPVRAG